VITLFSGFNLPYTGSMKAALCRVGVTSEIAEDILGLTLEDEIKAVSM
jgi:hypothetical protein